MDGLFTVYTPSVFFSQALRKLGLDTPPAARDTVLDKMNDPRTPRRRVVEATPRKPRAELQSVRVICEPDLDPDTSYLHEKGRAAYERGDFQFIGVRAEAEVSIEDTVQVLESRGTWGIESDADEYIEQVAAHEWGVLRKVLTTVGVPTTELPLEVEQDWIEWRK